MYTRVQTCKHTYRKHTITRKSVRALTLKTCQALPMESVTKFSEPRCFVWNGTSSVTNPTAR